MPASHDPMVCGCNGVTRSMVVEAIRTQGLTEPMQVTAATRAGRGCGACFGAINQLVNSSRDCTTNPRNKA